MLLRFWGTRGSIATPGPSTIRYGGNTSCVEIVTDAGKRFICDCGTGARELGSALMRAGKSPIQAAILLSHTHWDHIQGFPFFAPLFVPGNAFTIYGPSGANTTLPDVLAGQMEYTYFPVELEQLGAHLEYKDLSEGAHEIDGVRVTAQFLNHPAAALGYRIEADGISILYLCDHEPYWEALWCSDAEPGHFDSILHDGDRRHAAFMENADVVIHDAQYTPEEYPAKKNWGHSTWSYVTQIAAAAHVKHLFLTHHDPTHNDDALDAIERNARELARSLGSPMRITCAREGFEQTFLPAPGPHLKVNEVPTVSCIPESGPCDGDSLRVLVIDDDEDLRILARKALVRAGHHVFEACGGEEGFDIIRDHGLNGTMPNLILLDLFMPAPDGFEVLRRLRDSSDTRGIPVLVFTAHGDEESARRSFELGATDFLAKPFTPPQLNARVRSCFARGPLEKSEQPQ